MGCGDSKQIEGAQVQQQDIRPAKQKKKPVKKKVVHEKPPSPKHEVEEVKYHKKLTNLKFHNRQYDFTNEQMNNFNIVHFNDPQRADNYFNQRNEQDQCQNVVLDLEDAEHDQLKQMAGLLGKRAKQIQNLKLSFYENNSKLLNIPHFQPFIELTKDSFKDFMSQVGGSEKLKKLDLNLRWLDQVDNDWCEHIAEALNGKVKLNELEIWLWNNKQVDDHGFNKILESLQNQNQLTSLKLFLSIYFCLEGSGCTMDGVGHSCQQFAEENDHMNIRIKGNGDLDINMMDRH